MACLGFNYAYRRAPPSASTASTTATPANALKGLPSSAPSPAPPATSPVPLAGANGALPTLNGTISPSPVVANGVNTVPKPPTTEVPTATPDKVQKKKFSTSEKKERKSVTEVEGASKPSSPAPQNHKKRGSKGTTSPIPAASPSPAPDNDNQTTSPAMDARASLKSPSGGRPARHPWTLYVSRLPVPITEAELRQAFPESNEQVGISVVVYGPKLIAIADYVCQTPVQWQAATSQCFP